MASQHEMSDLEAKNYFFVRRLHSLLGLVPVGVFLCVHIFANASILSPGEPGAEFQKSVERIHALGPLLVPVEIIFIFLPLLFHALLGVKIWMSSTPNARNYTFWANWRYTLQRITGGIAFVFILYHVWQMHWFGKPFGGGHFELYGKTGGPMAASSTAQVIQTAWWIAPLYVVGIVAAVFHLANGVWTSLITWGVTIRPQTQRASGYVCAVLGIVLCIAGLGAVRGFRTFDLNETSASSSLDGASAMHAP